MIVWVGKCSEMLAVQATLQSEVNVKDDDNDHHHDENMTLALIHKIIALKPQNIKLQTIVAIAV